MNDTELIKHLLANDTSSVMTCLANKLDGGSMYDFAVKTNTYLRFRKVFRNIRFWYGVLHCRCESFKWDIKEGDNCHIYSDSALMSFNRTFGVKLNLKAWLRIFGVLNLDDKRWLESKFPAMEYKRLEYYLPPNFKHTHTELWNLYHTKII